MKRKKSGFQIMKRLIVLVKPLSGFMALAIFLGVAGFLCAIQITVSGSLTLLSAAGIPGGIGVKGGCVFLAVFAVLRGFLHYGEQACNHYIAFKLLAIIRDRVFKALRRLSPAKLEGKDKGDLVSMITSDIELLEVFYAHTISPICIAVLTSLVMLVFIGRYSTVLSLVALLGYVTVGVIIPLVSSKFNRNIGMTYRTDAGTLSGFVLESMRGLLESIRYTNTEKRLEEMEDRTDKLNTLQMKLKKIEGHSSAATDISIIVFSLVMLVLGIALKNKGVIGTDGVIVSTVAMMSSFGPVVALSSLAGNLTFTLAAGERVLSILDEEPVVKENETGKEVIFSEMECRNVDFSYNGHTPVLKNFSIDAKPDEIIGITGESGSGKSTALKLMMRFWDADSGSISMSGENIKAIKTSSLRNNQSLVSQETQLFNESIEANIKIADFGATHEQVVEAAKKASIHDFIMTLPKGYDTNVGELGDLLSDGEKQRIGLARAFLKNSGMILLDEPTSNLDSLNEGRILRSLREFGKGKSIILVSHRKSTTRIADRTYSVKGGTLR
ncbi:MAG: ABC transporter ATP-binding protein [Clostridia bacterium]|nr:ABC transporter ATP-binding protein [Clostridia bacterium]